MRQIKLHCIKSDAILVMEFDSDDFFTMNGNDYDQTTEIKFKSGKNPVIVKETAEEINKLILESQEHHDNDTNILG